MSPEKIKKIRVRLGLTQKSMAKAFGIGELGISHYETGFRKPGGTVLLLLMVLDALSEKKALELIELFHHAALKREVKSKRLKD